MDIGELVMLLCFGSFILFVVAMGYFIATGFGGDEDDPW